MASEGLNDVECDVCRFAHVGFAQFDFEQLEQKHARVACDSERGCQCVCHSIRSNG